MKWQMNQLVPYNAEGNFHDDGGFAAAHNVVSYNRVFFSTRKNYMGGHQGVLERPTW